MNKAHRLNMTDAGSDQGTSQFKLAGGTDRMRLVLQAITQANFGDANRVIHERQPQDIMT